MPVTTITLWRMRPGRCLGLGVHRYSFPAELCRSPFRFTLGLLIVEMKTSRLRKSQACPQSPASDTLAQKSHFPEAGDRCRGCRTGTMGPSKTCEQFSDFSGTHLGFFFLPDLRVGEQRKSAQQEHRGDSTIGYVLPPPNLSKATKPFSTES